MPRDIAIGWGPGQNRSGHGHLEIQGTAGVKAVVQFANLASVIHAVDKLGLKADQSRGRPWRCRRYAQDESGGAGGGEE